jgi:L-idonate 5-dehydrogenase
MRAVISHEGSVSVIDKPEPTGPGELIRVTSSGICGSDLHLVALGLSGVVLGHEFGGYTPDGRLVAVRPTGECGACPQCARGIPNTCSTAASSLHGTSIDGGLAEFAMVESERLITMHPDVPAAAVGLVEPLAVVVHGIHRSGATEGMRALVVGAGSIGLLCAAVLHNKGVHVDIVARHSHQADAASHLGASVVNNPSLDYDITFDAVCTQQSFDTCATSTRPGGTILEFGMFWTPVAMNNLVMLKEITIIPSIFYNHNHATNDFTEAARLLHSLPHITSAIVTHTFFLDDATHAFDVAQDKQSRAIKVHLFTN